MDELTRLALAARGGEPGAFEAFIRAAHEPVWRLCEALVDAQAADDLTQDTFVKAVGAIRRFRGDSSARTWLLAIARNTCMDELRTRSRRLRPRDTLPAADERADLGDPGDEVGARDLLARLDVDRRTAFTLTQLLGLTYEEAAATCGCPIGTIRSRVARARNDLIEMVGGAIPVAAPDDRQPRSS